jgi:hypothetical protein
MSFWQTPLGHLILIFGEALALLVPLLIMVAYLTYAERKVLAAIQVRKGPNVVGPFGLLQPFADALKMLMKETIIPSGANRFLFLIAPLITFGLAMVAWAVIPVNAGWAIANINVGILYLFAISSLGVYGIIVAGWASNSRYAFLGAMRSAAQMVSYEVSIGFVIVSVLLCAGSLNLSQIVLAQQKLWFFIPDVHRFLRLGAGGDQPLSVRSTGRRKRDRGRLLRRIQLIELRAVLPWRVCQHDPDERDDHHPVPWRLARPVRVMARDRPDLVHPEGLHLPVCLHLGAWYLPSLPLRPAHASRLESIPAGQPGVVGRHSRRAARHRVPAHPRLIGS